MKHAGLVSRLLCVALLGPAAANGEVATAHPDPLVERVMAAFDVPGMSLSIVHGDEIIHARGYGVREAGGRRPVNRDTVFQIGSNGKSFTAAAVATLVSRGEMNWDDPAVDHLPQFRLASGELTMQVTLRDLLSMRTGLGAQSGLALWYGTGLSRDEVLHRMRYLQPEADLRTTFAYSNLSILAAGMAVAARANMTWDTFIRQNLFEPLDMRSSDTLLAETLARRNRAEPHERRNDGNVPIPYRSADNMAPAGSISSTARDMANYLRFQLNEGRFGGTTRVAPEVFREMHEPQTIISRDSLWGMLFPDSRFITYGLGWFVVDISGHRAVLHGGSIDGMNALMLLVPEADLGLVALSNIDLNHAHTLAFAREYLDLALSDSGVDWIASSADMLAVINAGAARVREAVAVARKPGSRPSLPASAYAGDYASSLFGRATITVAGDTLRLSRGPGLEGELTHWYGDSFRPEWADTMPASGYVRFQLSGEEVLGFSEGALGLFRRLDE